MYASGSPKASSTLPSWSQTARRPWWTLSTSAPRVMATSAASSGRSASVYTVLPAREADDVEGQEILGHPHPAHRNGGLAARQVLASLPDQGSYLLERFVVLAAGTLVPQACFDHPEHGVDPRARGPHGADRNVHVAVDP